MAELVYQLPDLDGVRTGDRATLVGLCPSGTAPDEVSELLDELGQLAMTLGVVPGPRHIVRVRERKGRYLVGSGKAREIVEAARGAGCALIVFDEMLTPSQQRNWLQLAALPVIDRQALILAIFAARARTREAELQVALAQAIYTLPRLKRQWGHLSRQRGMRGGLGSRGEGEQQIETDYRLVQRRIIQLRRQLVQVRRQRTVQRHRRLKRSVPVAAFVGYTNAGKSSLLNALTGAGLGVEDKLFATLDPAVRRLLLPGNREMLLTDTVGFIRKLPHLLVDAFRATLEEIALADFLVEVVDVTSTRIGDHIGTTREVLREIGVETDAHLLVFNKLDLAWESSRIHRLRREYPNALFVSSTTGENLDLLVDRLAVLTQASTRRLHLLIPHDRYDLIAMLHRTSRVVTVHHSDDGVRVEASVPPSMVEVLRSFLATDGV